MFYGEFEYKTDEKGRVPIPPKFRPELEQGLIVTPGPEECIAIYPLSEWEKLASGFSANGSLESSKLRRLKRALFATAFNLQIDGQGRIALPAPLRKHAGIESGVAVVGVNNYIEIWSKEHWEEEKAESQQQAWQIIESLERH